MPLTDHREAFFEARAALALPGPSLSASAPPRRPCERERPTASDVACWGVHAHARYKKRHNHARCSVVAAGSGREGGRTPIFVERRAWRTWTPLKGSTGARQAPLLSRPAKRASLSSRRAGPNWHHCDALDVTSDLAQSDALRRLPRGNTAHITSLHPSLPTPK